MANPVVGFAFARTVLKWLPGFLMAGLLVVVTVVMLTGSAFLSLTAAAGDDGTEIDYGNVEISPDGWTRPAAGGTTSQYGPRPPICGSWGCTPPFHDGLDFPGGGSGAPIWAVNDGVVSKVFIDVVGNWRVKVAHGSGVESEYWHMWPDEVYVKPGQKVKAGQVLAGIGDSGASVGCHLHFVMYLNGQHVNPRTFLTDRGVELY